MGYLPRPFLLGSFAGQRAELTTRHAVPDPLRVPSPRVRSLQSQEDELAHATERADLEWMEQVRREAAAEKGSTPYGDCPPVGSSLMPSAEHPLAGDAPTLPARSPLPNGRSLLASRQTERHTQWSSPFRVSSSGASPWVGAPREGDGVGVTSGSFADAVPARLVTSAHRPTGGPDDEIANGWEALQGPLAALFLDEPPVDVQRQVAQVAHKSRGRPAHGTWHHPAWDRPGNHHRGESWGDDVAGDVALSDVHQSRGGAGSDGGRNEGNGGPEGASGAAPETYESPSFPVTVVPRDATGGGGKSEGMTLRATEKPSEDLGERVGNWLKDLWAQLIEDDVDEVDTKWRDRRRGRGGTPSGAVDLRKVEDGQEMEMELVLSPEAEMHPGRADEFGVGGHATYSTPASAASAHGHGGTAGGGGLPPRTPASVPWAVSARPGGGFNPLTQMHGATPKTTQATPDGRLYQTPTGQQPQNQGQRNCSDGSPSTPAAPPPYSFDDNISDQHERLLDPFADPLTPAARGSEPPHPPPSSSSGAKLPDVFPGIRPMPSPYAGAEATALEVQRLWGNPGRFVSFEDCRAVLVHLSETRPALAACDAAIGRFNFAYNTPPSLSPEERLVAWRGAAVDVCNALLRALIASGGRLESCATTPRHRESLLNVVEGYVMGGIQGKVLDGISRTFAGDDAAFQKVLERIERLPPKALGMHPSHLRAIDAFAVGSLRGLAQLSCPRHMATAVCDVMRHLAGNCARLRTWSEEERAEKERQREKARAEAMTPDATPDAANSGGIGRGKPVGEGERDGMEAKDAFAAITHDAPDDKNEGDDAPAAIPSTDDLLSLLVVLVAKARPKRAVSLAAYMDAFHALVGSAHKGELGFALANFLGAIQYIRSEQMDDLLRKWEENPEQ